MDDNVKAVREKNKKRIGEHLEMKFAESTTVIEGNAIFEETVTATVDPESISHILRSLTDMYSNPYLAMAREYLSNGYDATITRMGSDSPFGTILDKPVEISLPSALNPNFVVKDYGTGMDRDILSNVFLKYGASTKRENNSEIGGFGLGAKSALAVVPNFTVMSVKDGKKNVGIIQKNESGVGEISFLPEVDTDEPSGTTITITLPKPYELTDIFQRSDLLIGFPHGSVMVNGKMQDNSVHNPEKFVKLSENGWLQTSLLKLDGTSHRGLTGWNSLLVVVGPISYTVDFSDLDSTGNLHLREAIGNLSQNVVVNLPIGSVDFTPARENLIFTERTRNAIMERAKALTAEAMEYITDSIVNADSYSEALYLYNRLNTYFPNGLEYKGEKIPVLNTHIFAQEDETAFLSDFRKKVTPSVTHFRYLVPESRVVVVLGVEEQEEAARLNRFRKIFADRHDWDNVNTDNLVIIYSPNKSKSDFSKWATEGAHALFFTAAEWEAKGIEYRRALNAERRAARPKRTKSENAANKTITAMYATSGWNVSRPTKTSYTISQLGAYETVIYMNPSDSENSMSYKFAKASLGGISHELSQSALLAAMRALQGYFKREATMFVRLNARANVTEFLKEVPQAISVDAAIEKMLSVTDEGNLTALYCAAKGDKIDWLSEISPNFDEIHNEEVRDIYREILRAKERNTIHHEIRTRNNWMVEFQNHRDFAALTKELRERIEKVNPFPLPLLDTMSSFCVPKPQHVIEYINLKYPASAELANMREAAVTAA